MSDITVTRDQTIAWLKLMMDDLGLNLYAVLDLHVEVDRILITCIYSEEPQKEFPPSVRVVNQPGAGDFTPLTYRVEARIIDVEAKS